MNQKIKRNVSDTQWFLFLIFIALVLGILMNGCETVKVKERVVYGETGEPVKGAPVRQWNESFKGTTVTNNNGEWTMTVPPDVLMNLCIFDNVQKFEACYTEGYLLTPTVESGSHEMIHIDK